LEPKKKLTSYYQKQT